MGDSIRKILTTSLFVILLLDIVFPSNILVFSTLSITAFSYLGIKPKQLKINYNLYFLIFLLFFTTVISFQFSSIDSANMSLDIFNSTNFNLFLSLLTFIFIPFLFRRNKIIFETSVDNSLKIITGFFYFQLVVYYTTGIYIEILEYLRGDSSRYAIYSTMDVFSEFTGFDFIRPTSIFNEPGTYCCFASTLFILSWVKHKKILIFHILFLISLFVSLSGFGIILGIIFILLIYFTKLKSKFIFSFININIIIPIIVLMIMFINYYYEVRFLNDLSGSGGGINIRKEVIDVFNVNIKDNILFGLSSGFNKIQIFYVQDTSLFFSIIYNFGLCAIIIFIILFKFFKFDLIPIVLLLIISLTKIPFDSFALWFFLVSLSLIYYGNSKKIIREI